MNPNTHDDDLPDDLHDQDTDAVMFLTFEEADFMQQCCRYEGLFVYAHQPRAMAMAARLEASGLVTIQRTGPVWIVSAVRPESEED